MNRPIEKEIYAKVKKAACKPVITKSYPTGVELSKQFGISTSTVHKILKTKSYDDYKMYNIKRRLRFKNGVIQTKGNMMEDYDE